MAKTPPATNTPAAAMGARARARREALGISVKTLAHQLDVATGRLYQMEQFGVQSIDIACAWAKALDMAPRDLIFGAPLPKPKRAPKPAPRNLSLKPLPKSE